MKVVTFTQKKERKPFLNIFLVLIIGVFFVSVYLLYRDLDGNSDSLSRNVQLNSNSSIYETALSEELTISNLSIVNSNSSSTSLNQSNTQDEVSVLQDSQTSQSTNTSLESNNFSEFTQIISGQTAYIAVPSNIAETNLPSIVIYSHGSGDTVVSKLNANAFMSNLSNYGNYFAKNNLIFAASNEHGENWGSSYAVSDMNNLIAWIKENYPVSGKVYLIGYSMGGLPTMNFALKYPDKVSKVALLAPTIYLENWYKTTVEKIKNIDITIWHGYDDKNLPLSGSQLFANRLKTYGKIIVLNDISGINHISVNTKFVPDIANFFAND